MCELAVAEDLATRFRAYIANDDVDAVGHLLTHDHVALGLSDAGAHVDQLCDAPLPTDLLGTWVRDRAGHAARARGAQAHRRARRHVRLRAARLPARGLLGRRVRVRPADGRAGPDAARRATSRPTRERLTAEEPTGVRHVLVNGTPIRVDEQQVEALGVLPGTRPETI